MSLKIVTTLSFSKEVDSLVVKTNFTYIEAVCHLIKLNDIDFSEISSLLTPQIKAKLQAEGYALNLIGRGKTKTKKIEFE